MNQAPLVALPRASRRPWMIAVAIAALVAAIAIAWAASARASASAKLAEGIRGHVLAREYDRARAGLKDYLRLRPADGWGRLYLARVELGQDHPQEAINALARAMELGYPPSELAPYYAIVQSRGDQHGQAEPVLLKALAESDEPRPEVAEALVRLYLRTFRLREARAPLDRWTRDAPRDPRPFLWRNEIEMRSDADHAVLIQNYKAALEIDPGLPEARLGLADRLRQAHRLPEAVEQYARYVRLRPEDPEGHVGSGLVAMEQGRVDDAATEFDRALKAAPREPVSLKNLAQIDLSRGRFAPARDRLLKLLEIDPFDPDTHYNLARALRQMGDAKSAARHEALASKLRGEHSRLADLRSELVKRPRDLALRSEIAQWLLDHGHDPEGLVFAREILRDHPAHPPAVRMLVAYYTRKKEPGEANFYRLLLRGAETAGASPKP